MCISQSVTIWLNQNVAPYLGRETGTEVKLIFFFHLKLHLTPDTWHLPPDTWHLPSDTSHLTPHNSNCRCLEQQKVRTRWPTWGRALPEYLAPNREEPSMTIVYSFSLSEGVSQCRAFSGVGNFFVTQDLWGNPSPVKVLFPWI